jgi:hypothetical protein
MAGKDLKYGVKARESILKGINTLADAVKVTLGFCWKNPLAPPQSPRTASVLPKKLSCRINLKTWAPRW